MQDVPQELDEREEYIIQVFQNTAKNAILRTAGGRKHDNFWFYNVKVKLVINMDDTHLSSYRESRTDDEDRSTPVTEYDIPFTFYEMDRALSQARDTAPGSDGKKHYAEEYG